MNLDSKPFPAPKINRSGINPMWLITNVIAWEELPVVVTGNGKINDFYCRYTLILFFYQQTKKGLSPLYFYEVGACGILHKMKDSRFLHKGNPAQNGILRPHSPLQYRTFKAIGGHIIFGRSNDKTKKRL